MSSSIALADYLLTRLKQLGIESIHGVPGDYNLELLDHVEDLGFNWVGNCNELNAGYAADGYARIKGAGALITTFGVGELSAINAIAGAYAELAPVIHIVGTPKRHSRDTRALIHHTLNDGEYTYFSRMAEHVTVAQAMLDDPRTSPALIDTAIQQCLLHSRPVYIALPADMVTSPVDATTLKTPITLPKVVSSSEEAKALEYVSSRIAQSRKPLILVDGESRAYGLLDDLDTLITRSQWPTWTSTFGKGLVNEQHPNVMGMWKDGYCAQDHRDYFASADLILCFGPHFSGTNTYLYATIPSPKISVLFESNAIKAEGQVFRDLPARHFLQALLRRLDSKALNKDLSLPIRPQMDLALSSSQLDKTITQELFYRHLNQHLRDGDIILGETGTAGYGCRDLVLPAGCRTTLPVTWLSIGYMLPAAQGAALAQRELHKAGAWPGGDVSDAARTILLIGDGSVQMTVQEISTMIRQELNIVIIVLNNDGYTIEKCIHGHDRAYNGIASWNYLEAPRLFGASSNPEDRYHAVTAQARTYADIDEFFDGETKVSKARLSMLEVFLEEKDAPVVLLGMLNAQMK